MFAFSPVYVYLSLWPLQLLPYTQNKLLETPVNLLVVDSASIYTLAHSQNINDAIYYPSLVTPCRLSLSLSLCFAYPSSSLVAVHWFFLASSSSSSRFLITATPIFGSFIGSCLFLCFSFLSVSFWCIQSLPISATLSSYHSFVHMDTRRNERKEIGPSNSRSPNCASEKTANVNCVYSLMNLTE